MESKHIADLLEWVGKDKCAHIKQIDMFQSLAGGLQKRVRDIVAEGPWTGLWEASGDTIFPELKSVVITYPIDIVDDAMEVSETLQTLFGKPDLDVEFVRARFWQ